MKKSNHWYLARYDIFAMEWYPVEGEYSTEALAIEAAKQRLRELEQSQPTSQSGGQLPLGIQDRVFVVAPDSKRRRIFPQNDATGAAVPLLAAVNFAAQKHSPQRRKDRDATLYINHPIAVAEVLARTGAVTDLTTLQAAILHDTLEDTQTTPQELEEHFGQPESDRDRTLHDFVLTFSGAANIAGAFVGMIGSLEWLQSSNHEYEMRS